ncbi:aminotransferase class I/II-fold pyridoxal phosphate-dependent enzyme [Acinetobacter baumannii]|uniref:aminotransferase class I/II-fold pyridoxal phosphate-dependent enzyme n=13 Tax=Gammaproteobacteria TaxID=1236 RepID=UPI001D0DB3B2|nr:aminotransferase class I/II-fold pyridoxal phosphate-dependent enzyme [Acinetobacter baumannii]
MNQSDDLEYQLDTLAIRTGHTRSFEGEHGEPIFLTSSFVYENAAEAAAKFSGQVQGNIYSRFTNPTVSMFEKRLAALDGAERAVATSSGMGAILSIAMAYLKAGDHVICSRAVFGSIVALFEKYIAKFGVDITFVDLSDLNAWKNAVRPETKLLFVESPSNPLAEIADIQALADIAHANGALLAVDNSFCTPVLQQPLKLGADLVIYSATKYLDGQGRALGGAVVGNHQLLEEVFSVVRTLGPSMSPFNAWIFLKGLETLRLRMKAHCENAQKLAEWLSTHERNRIKVLMLFDVGGSMDAHIAQCEKLFSAAKTEFKTLEYFYFHNCLYDYVWKDNYRRTATRMNTWDLFHTYGRDYRVIVVGDASMAPYELKSVGGSVEYMNDEAGEVWLRRLRQHFDKTAWLNPETEGYWHYTQTIGWIKEIFENHMYPMTLKGIEDLTRYLSR